MSSGPKFDIILPTIVNGPGRSLFNALNSVTRQSYENWTLYVVADSTAIPSTLVQSFPQPNIRWLEIDTSELDSGTVARNHGITHGDAEWIAYLDDDDEWKTKHLQTLVDLIEENPEAIAVCTSGQSFKVRGTKKRGTKSGQKKLLNVDTGSIYTVGMAHRRDMFEKTSKWQNKDNHDLELWLEFEEHGERVKSDKSTFIFRR